MISLEQFTPVTRPATRPSRRRGMKQTLKKLLNAGALSFLLAAPALAGCPADSMQVGPICVDKYEASVWSIPANKTTLINKVRNGTATLANLTSTAGVVQRGAVSDNYGAGCQDTGNGCMDFYAVSVPGVLPSAYITWFQAVAACRNAGKRLLTNQEWQAAALGTPDGAPCIVATGDPGFTGTAGCVSDVGVFDMVGNVVEWVAEWVPRATTCSDWGGFSDDIMCLAGADTIVGPGALRRGGTYLSQETAGVFAVFGNTQPSGLNDNTGFRCGR